MTETTVSTPTITCAECRKRFEPSREDPTLFEYVKVMAPPGPDEEADGERELAALSAEGLELLLWLYEQVAERAEASLDPSTEQYGYGLLCPSCRRQ